MKKSGVIILLCIVFSFMTSHSLAADWYPMISSTTNNLNGVWGSSGSNVFAVGDSGTILHYDGTAWSSMASPTTSNLNEVWGTSASHVFAVGDNGSILHYDGLNWLTAQSNTTNNLNGVWGNSSSYAYTVGDNGTFLYYNGSWSIPMPPGTFTTNLNAVWGTSGSDIFVVGDNGIIGHFGGIPGGFMDSGTTEKLNDIWGNASNAVYAVGTNGTFLLYNGYSWSAPMAGFFTYNFNAIWGSSGSDIFVVCDDGAIGHFGGTPPGGPMDSGTTEDLYDIWGSSGSNVFAVGANGTILHYSPPSCVSVNPQAGYQGETFDVTITGINTNFTDSGSTADSTTVSFGCTGITVNSTTVNSATQVTANISIAPDAPSGYCDVMVSTGSEVVTCDNAFFIIPPQPPYCAFVNPQSGYRGQTFDVTIIGADTNFIDTGSTANSTTVSFGCTGITVNSTTINSSTQVTANISIAPDAPYSSCDVTVITGSEVITCGNAFSVIPAPPNANLQDLLIYYASLYGSPQKPAPMFVKKVVARAQSDECFNGIGNPYPPGPPCSEGKPKVNEAYVWGLTKAKNVWLGTAPNVLCLVIGGILQSESVPIEAPSFVCEFGESQLVPPLPVLIGDWRPPKIYEYDPATQDIEDRTPLAGPLINRTLGLRSAGSLNDVIFLAGPNLGGGINMFTFKSDGTSLGARTFSEYSNIRKWIAVDGVLYTAVGNTAGGGSVLRWIGDDIDPFQFEIVGKLDNEGSNIALHEGRLFVTTWPAKVGQSLPMGLYMSPVVPIGGLTTANKNNWIKIWKATDYEPDTLVVRTYGGGDLASFDGTLFWGTMHVPFLATQAALTVAEQGVINLDPVGDGIGADDLLTTALGTHRAISIFAGKNFGTPDQQIELLYGDQYLPVYDPAAKSYTIAYDLKHQNRMPNPIAKFGPSGIGNFFNSYTWTMETGFKTTPGVNSLLIGTFDWSYVLEQMIITLVMQQFGLNSVTPGMPLDSATLKDFMEQLPSPGFGADLFRVWSADEPFTLESNDGAGNYLNYGIRTMLPTQEEPPQSFCSQTSDQDVFYLGMANPMNLATDPNKPLGGWELIKLCSPPQVSVTFPKPDQALQDGVTLQAQAVDMCGVDKVLFYVREAGGDTGIPIGFEGLPATFNTSTCRWEYAFDTTKLQDGYYVVLAKAVSSDKAGWSTVVPFSIRNWAVITLLPATPNNKAGRTMPVKFSLRIARGVDPAMPFVYNEDLEIRIYDAKAPGTILQKSVFGTGSTNYRIDLAAKLYLTNFKTKTTPATYVVEIWRPTKNFMVGSFTFKTVK